MTREEREETIEYLELYRRGDEALHNFAPINSASYYATQKALEYWDNAIEALKAEPCVDAVSKSNFDSRVRAAVGMVEEELTEDFKDGIKMVLELLKTEPPVTPERPKGEWIKDEENPISTFYHCSLCGRRIEVFADIDEFPFCHCGADMKGEQE